MNLSSGLPPWKCTRRKIYYLGRRLSEGCRRVWSAVRSFSRDLWFGDEVEKQKKVLRSGFWRNFSRCFTHILTLGATLALAYLNLGGFFIGYQFQGCATSNCQTLDRLGLQVAAKFLELLMVASLASIFVDIIRSQLLSGPDGLPLGLLFSNKRFPELQYLISPEFRFGICGFSSWTRLLAFALFVFTSTLISLFAGPSAALLLIPDIRSNWPAGGASIWLADGDDNLWPSRLTALSSGGQACAFPTAQMLEFDNSKYIGCAWAGLSSISEKIKQANFSAPDDFTFDDGIVRRNFDMKFRGVEPETWVTASHLAVGVLSKNAGEIWFQALLKTPTSSPLHRLRWRSQGGSRCHVDTKAPTVRVRCDTFDPAFYIKTGLQKYPYLPEYDISLDTSLVLPANITSASHLSTNWIKVPKKAMLSNHTMTSDLPSAFLNVVIPHENSNSTVTPLTCSIDARWVQAKYEGGAIDSFNQHYVQSATILHSRRYSKDLNGWQHSSLPVDGGTWQKVQLDNGWLEALNPSLDNSTFGSTALAAAFRDMGTLNITDHNVVATMELIIAAVVADGMSRTGISAMIKNPEDLVDPLSLLVDDSDSSWHNLMTGKHSFLQPEGPSTKLEWSVTVEGYAYRADGKAYWLALAVLFLHALLALLHMGYVVYNRVYCDAWDAITKLFVLAAVSGVSNNPVITNGSSNAHSGLSTGGLPHLFENAASGINRYRTMSTEVRIRAKRTSEHVIPTSTAHRTHTEHVEMIFGAKDSVTLEQEGYKDLKTESSYG